MANCLPISLKRSLRYLEIYLRPRQLYEIMFKVDGKSGLDVISEGPFTIYFATAKEMQTLD